MKTILCGLAMFALAFSASPCINKSGTKYGGESGPYFGNSHSLQLALAKDLRPDGVKMEADLRDATGFNDRSDYAVALMYLGRASEAVERLQKLEAEKPGEYFIAANLGTAYELAGQNEEARRWILEGIRRNPRAHEGTEWLHVKILEAKLAAAKDPAYFTKHSVLELHPESLGARISVGDRTLSPADLADAIEYQLHERLQFVKPSDPAVASLLFDYAAIESHLNSMESARSVLKLAGDFGYPKEKIAALNADFDRKFAQSNFKSYFICGIIGAPILWWLILLHKRGSLTLTRNDLGHA